MPSGADGKHYRTHGQAARFGGTKEPSQDKTGNAEGGAEVGGKEMKGEPKNVIMVKHAGTPEAPEPPFHVKMGNGDVAGPMNTVEEFHAHMHSKMGGDSELEHDQNHEALDSVGGTQEAIESLLG